MLRIGLMQLWVLRMAKEVEKPISLKARVLVYSISMKLYEYCSILCFNEVALIGQSRHIEKETLFEFILEYTLANNRTANNSGKLILVSHAVELDGSSGSLAAAPTILMQKTLLFFLLCKAASLMHS